MGSSSRIFVTGVGLSDSKKGSLVSSTTKALLDAGLHFDDVDQAVVGSKDGHAALKEFDKRGIATQDAKSGSELEKAYSLISGGKASCVLMVASEKSVSVSLVLASDIFLWRHPYLKDSAVVLEESGSSAGEKGFEALSQIVFAQRGWSQSQGSVVQVGTKSYNLKRADGKGIPKWKDIEHKQDGRDRLGYNPANEMKDLRDGDFDAVKAIEGEGRKLNSMRSDRAALAKL